MNDAGSIGNDKRSRDPEPTRSYSRHAVEVLRGLVPTSRLWKVIARVPLTGKLRTYFQTNKHKRLH